VIKGPFTVGEVLTRSGQPDMHALVNVRDHLLVYLVITYRIRAAAVEEVLS